MATNQNAFRLNRTGLRFAQMLGVLLSLTMAGCVGQGLLYTRVVRPYTKDFHGTVAGTKTCRVDERRFQEPVSRAGVSVVFTSRVVAEAARAAGITNLYFADKETFSILLGIYERNTLILSGD